MRRRKHGHAHGEAHGHAEGHRTTWEPFESLGRLYDLVPVPTHARAIRRVLRGKGGTVLDLGGGTAKYTVRIFDPKKDRIVVADPSGEMLARAQRKRRPVRLARCVGQKLPFTDGSVDVVIATESFHHFADAQDATVDEVARVLRPDGVFVVEEPDVARVPGRFMAWQERVGRLGSHFLDPDALAEKLRRRFSDVRVSRASWMTVIAHARGPQPL